MAETHEQELGSTSGFSSPLSSLPSSMPSTPTSFSFGSSVPKNEEVVDQKNDDIDEEDVNQNNNDISEEDAEDNAPLFSILGKRKRKSTIIKATPYYGNQQEGKPLPSGAPRVWADKRQQLCEALPYYNAYQSGAYTKDGVVYGFMCDGEVGDRDYFGDQIMIARVGGGKTVDEETGQRVQTKSQDDCNLALAFIKSKENYEAVGVIAGQGNKGSPSKLPHYYNVLDHFQVTDIWCEKYNDVSRWMVRLEKINLNERSWWSAISTPHFPPNFDSPKAPIATCRTCRQPSKVIYKQGWACLNSDPEKKSTNHQVKTTCPEFFKFGQNVDDKTLVFTEEFLHERTPFRGTITRPLVPPFLADQPADVIGSLVFKEKCRKGIVCSRCGCCNRRVHWGKWVCENPDCNRIIRLTPCVIGSSLAMSGCKIPREKTFVSKIIGSSVLNLCSGLWKVIKYDIPGEDSEIVGNVFHFKSSAKLNELPNGPDDLFRELQEADLGMKRNPSKCPGARNEILTAHWATNWGAPYKYRVSQESTSFKNAPAVIIKALKRLTWAGKEAVAAGFDKDAKEKKFQPFNEMLSVGYLEKSKMGYHDDGEDTLGETVASMSFGSSSSMCWRPKAKNSIVSENEHINQTNTKKDVLKIHLEHGDIMVMHGSGIQKYFEHTVFPHGKYRIALTCRNIVLAKVKESEQKSAEEAGQLPEWSSQYEYDGDTSTIFALEHMDAQLPKDKTQEDDVKWSSIRALASQDLRKDYEPNGMQRPHPPPQDVNEIQPSSDPAPSSSEQAAALIAVENELQHNLSNEWAPPSLALAARGNTQHQYVSNELTASSEHAAGTFSSRDEQPVYHSIYAPIMGQAAGDFPPQALQYQPCSYSYGYEPMIMAPGQTVNPLADIGPEE